MIESQMFHLVCLSAVLLLKLNPSEADLTQRLIFRDDNYSNTTSQPASGYKPEDPCAPYNPPLPNFSRPGRRISTAKCYEYIWQMKTRADKAMRERKCERQKERIRNGGYLKAVPQIINGRHTLRGEFPNMGAIGWKAVEGGWMFKCGSSLISSKFVLTAAHCSSASIRDTTVADIVPKIVRLGETSIMDSFYDDINKPHDANIIRIIVHPNYKSPKKYFDIALMELGTEVKFSTDILPVCLWNAGEILKYGRTAEIAGWGVVRSGSNDMSPKLQAAEVDIIDSDECDALLQPNCNRNWCGLQDQICAGKLQGGADSCQGDSGGPLQVKIPLPIQGQGSMHYIIGVTSFGIGCGLANLPGVYTRVSSFVDWIENIVWK